MAKNSIQDGNFVNIEKRHCDPPKISFGELRGSGI
tara:strand:- start:5 stop:109 length:105 start_codon:yes stop_codon:yes gene_type:complete